MAEAFLHWGFRAKKKRVRNFQWSRAPDLDGDVHAGVSFGIASASG